MKILRQSHLREPEPCRKMVELRSSHTIISFWAMFTQVATKNGNGLIKVWWLIEMRQCFANFAAANDEALQRGSTRERLWSAEIHHAKGTR